MIRSADPLDRHIKALLRKSVHLHCLQPLQKGRSCIPVHQGGLTGHVFPLCRGERDDLHLLQPQAAAKIPDLTDDGIKCFPAVAGQIHFVDGKYKLTDSHEGTDPRVPPGLGQDAFCGVDQDDGQIRKAGADRHVAGIFLMARCIRDDKTPLLGRKISVGDINGDALFPLRHEPVQKQGIIDLSPAGAHTAVQLQSFLLICVQQLCVI